MMYQCQKCGLSKSDSAMGSVLPQCKCDWQTTPLMHKPAREWVGLTDEEMRDLEKRFNAERVRTSDEEYLVIYPGDYWVWQRAIEAKLREKNGITGEKK